MKNCIKGIITGIIIGIAAFSASAFAMEDIPVVLDGAKLVFDVPPTIVNDRTLVPMRAIFEAFGMEVEWSGETQTVTANKDGNSIEMMIGKDVFYHNGEAIGLDTPAQIIGDRTLVPVRAISESLDCEVKWDGDERKVIIISSPDKVIGTATINHMRCLIDYQPIDFVNVDGFTYLKATDLDDYGFDVTEENGDIYIQRNKTKLPMLIEKYKNGLVDKAWYRKSENPYHSNYCHSVMDIWVDPLYGKEFDIFEAKSSVFLDGDKCNAKNINGDMYMQADELQKYGKVTWIDAEEYYNKYYGSRYGNGYSEIRGDTLDIHVATDDLEKVHVRMLSYDREKYKDYTGYAIIDHGEHYGVEHGIFEYKNGKPNGMGYELEYYREVPVSYVYAAGEYEDGVLKNGIMISNVPEVSGDYIALYEVKDFEKTQLYPESVTE